MKQEGPYLCLGNIGKQVSTRYQKCIRTSPEEQTRQEGLYSRLDCCKLLELDCCKTLQIWENSGFMV